MTKPQTECRACGRWEGHYLNCPNSPRPTEVIIPAFEPLPDDKKCLECDSPAKNTRSQYCEEHSTRQAYQARAYRGRKALNEEKENEDV